MLKIAIVSEWFADGVGYSENCLPKALAKLGHEVHLIAGNIKPYFHRRDYAETYEPFFGPPVVPCGTHMQDGYWMHRLQHQWLFGLLRLEGIVRRIRTLRPQVVQTFDVVSLSTLESAIAAGSLGAPLFLEEHTHASVLGQRSKKPGRARAVARLGYPMIVGGFASARARKCYAISLDAAEVAVSYSRMSRAKVQVCPLGVDTDLFSPPDSSIDQHRRQEARQQLGFDTEDIVCVYTGRFSSDKAPLLLAQAVDRLASAGHPFRTLFVGGGTSAEIAALKACRGAVVRPFVPFAELPAVYRCADVGAWPKQESTSQLDAAACGLPLVLSDQTRVAERVAGNGLLYREGDVEDLAQRLLELADPGVRQAMGRLGSKRIRADFSWDRIAREREKDYVAAVRHSPRRIRGQPGSR